MENLKLNEPKDSLSSRHDASTNWGKLETVNFPSDENLSQKAVLINHFTCLPVPRLTRISVKSAVSH